MHNESVFGVSLTKVEVVVIATSCLLAFGGCSSNRPNGGTDTAMVANTSAPPASDFQKQHEQAEEQFRPQIEAERQKDEQEAEQALDRDAIAAVEETDQAIKSVAENSKGDAIGWIEQATGKINILLARNPAAALLPVSAQVVVIDVAPTDAKVIDQIVQQATDATKLRQLPAARTLLAAVVSELRIRTTSLPLGTYPAALKQAAQLLDQGKNQDAGNVLLTAVNTLVAVDHVIPLPLLLTQSAIDAANSQRQDKTVALALLQTAKAEADRSRHLGYLGDESEYKALDQEIASVETAVNGKGDTNSVFAQLRERITGLLKHEKQQEQRG